MPNVLAPAPLSSMRWNDAPATRASANPGRSPDRRAPARPQTQPPQAEEVQQPAADQVAPAAADAASAKPTASLQKLLLVMAAALALAGLTVSAIVRIGRMRARRAMRRKRRAMWDSAKTKKRRSPQPMFHDEDAGLRRTEGVHNPRVPQDRTRVPRSGHACRKSGRAYRRNGRACRKSGDARAPRAAARAPGTATRATGSRAPGSGAGAAGYGNAVPARPQRTALTETDAAAISPAGAAACERTRSGRCGARA